MKDSEASEESMNVGLPVEVETSTDSIRVDSQKHQKASEASQNKRGRKKKEIKGGE
jgi:hypothetical protein